MFQNIIFDWSGVIKDSVKDQLFVVNEIFKEYGLKKISLEDLMPEIINFGLEGVFNDVITNVYDKSDGIQKLIKKHDFKLENTIFIGDSNHVGRSDYLATLFNPDVIRTAPKEIELKKTGTLARYLKAINIPCVLIEMPAHDKVTREQIQRILQGLLLHLDQCAGYDKLKINTFDQIRDKKSQSRKNRPVHQECAIVTRGPDYEGPDIGNNT